MYVGSCICAYHSSVLYRHHPYFPCPSTLPLLSPASAVPLHIFFLSIPFSDGQESLRGKLLMAANASHNIRPTQPPSVIYHAALHPDKVISFERLAAQQTPEGLYSLIMYFSSSGPMVRMKCGIDGCNSTANPATTLPITCANKTTPHVHHTYDMIPTMFTIIPPNSAHDCGPKSPDGVPIPVSLSITTQVRGCLVEYIVMYAIQSPPYFPPRSPLFFRSLRTIVFFPTRAPFISFDHVVLLKFLALFVQRFARQLVFLAYALPVFHPPNVTPTPAPVD